MNPVFCRLPRRTTKSFAISGGRQTVTAKTGSAKAFFAVCFLQRTAKRPLPSVADDKGHDSLPSAGRRQRAQIFAICWQTAKAAGSLPSVGRWQRDQIGINSVSSYINSFSQKIKHKYIYMTNIAYSTHITNSHEHIYIEHISNTCYQ